MEKGNLAEFYNNLKINKTKRIVQICYITYKKMANLIIISDKKSKLFRKYLGDGKVILNRLRQNNSRKLDNIQFNNLLQRMK